MRVMTVFRAAPLLAAAAALDACPNASYALPAARRANAPVAPERFHAALASLARNASALEIGGPTTDLEGLYTDLPWRGVDIVNWAGDTAAVRRVGGGGEVFYAGDVRLGRLVIADGGKLGDFDAESYDVVMAFHVLEHFADPLRALRTWMRVLRPGGVLFLSVPWAPNTYDRNVPVSTIYDLVLAYGDDADASDLAPAAEAYWRARVAAYDVLVDREICQWCTADYDGARKMKGYHWHVWDLSLLGEAMACVGARVEYLDVRDHWHQFVVARKPAR